MRIPRLQLWSQYVFIAGLVLGALFIIPSAWFPLQLVKVAIVAICMFVAAILFVAGGGMQTLMRGRGPHLVALGGLLPLFYFISFLFSSDRSVGLTGFALESDTVLFVVLTFVVYVLGLGLFRTLRSTRIALIGVALAAAIATAFQFIVLMFGTSMLPAVFSDRSVNLVGKWNDLGLLIGLMVLILLLSLEFAPLNFKRRIAVYIAIAFGVLMLAIIHFPLIWSLLIVFSTVIALWAYVVRRPAGSGYFQMVPWIPVAGVIISGILLLWGTIVNTGLTGIFPVSSLEVRPSMTSSLGVVKDAHGSSVSNFLFGTGPQTFGQEWLMHKPASVNQSLFWNLDFNVAYSSIITALGTVGFFGALAWLLPLALALLSLVYALRSSHMTEREKLFSVYLSMGTLYLWGSLLFYVPSEILLLIAFALAGATFGFTFLKHHTDEASEHVPTKLFRSLGLVAAVILVLFSGWTAEVFARRSIAEAQTNQGLLELQQGHADVALSYANKSQSVEKNNDNLRLGVDAGLARLQQLAQTGATPTQQQIQDFASQAQLTIPQGQQAIEMNPKDYRAYISLGRVYDFLNSLNVAGAYDNAKAMYGKAAELNPTNPQIPLLMARLEAVKGNLPGVQAALQQSLTLKPDYTDAILFVVQLNVAQKDIPNAIRAAAAAVQSAPGVPSIWFELGLLYYAAGDTASAIPPLEEAIKRQNDYANAKYFLGLSYAAQNKPQEALQQFLDLEKSNPDNQEVKLIVQNLQAGRAPFTNAQPPVTTAPQNRTTAPISQ